MIQDNQTPIESSQYFGGDMGSGYQYPSLAKKLAYLWDQKYERIGTDQTTTQEDLAEMARQGWGLERDGFDIVMHNPFFRVERRGNRSKEIGHEEVNGTITGASLDAEPVFVYAQPGVVVYESLYRGAEEDSFYYASNDFGEMIGHLERNRSKLAKEAALKAVAANLNLTWDGSEESYDNIIEATVANPAQSEVFNRVYNEQYGNPGFLLVEVADNLGNWSNEHGMTYRGRAYLAVKI